MGSISKNLRQTRRGKKLTVADSSEAAIREHSVLVEVGQSLSLLLECRRKTMSIGPVVGELRVDVIVDLYLE